MGSNASKIRVKVGNIHHLRCIYILCKDINKHLYQTLSAVEALLHYRHRRCIYLPSFGRFYLITYTQSQISPLLFLAPETRELLKQTPRTLSEDHVPAQKRLKPTGSPECPRPWQSCPVKGGVSAVPGPLFRCPQRHPRAPFALGTAWGESPRASKTYLAPGCLKGVWVARAQMNPQTSPTVGVLLSPKVPPDAPDLGAGVFTLTVYLSLSLHTHTHTHARTHAGEGSLRAKPEGMEGSL